MHIIVWWSDNMFMDLVFYARYLRKPNDILLKHPYIVWNGHQGVTGFEAVDAVFLFSPYEVVILPHQNIPLEPVEPMNYGQMVEI